MKKKIAYIINHASFFYSHIIDNACYVRKNKYNVKLFCGLAASKKMDIFSKKKIKQKKIQIEQHSFQSSSINLFQETIGFLKLVKSIKEYNPDIIYCASPKGIVLGGLVSRWLNIKSLVIFNSGMGYLFSNKINFAYKLIKATYILLLKKIIMKHSNKKVIVENRNDYSFLKKKYNLNRNEIKLIKGAGVNLNKYKYKKNNSSKKILLPARVIKEKGIEEFIIASNNLKRNFPNWKFIVAGAFDYKKQSILSVQRIQILNKLKAVEFLGYVENMIKVYQDTAIVCLPSYREGFSRVFQEAAASGLPIVTTNVIGCKDSIIPNKTGLIAKVKDYKSLRDKLKLLILDKNKRLKFGKNGRKLAEKEFDLKNVLKANLNICNYLINNAKDNRRL